MILNRVVFSLAFIMQHTFTNALVPIQSKEGETIEGSHHNHQDSNHSMDTMTSYLRGNSKYSTMSNIRSEMSDRNLVFDEKCNIPSGTYFIQSRSRLKYMKISSKVELTKPNSGSLYDNSYIRSLGNSEYAIQSPWLEKYVRVPKSGKYRTVDTQKYAGSSETFYITCFGDGVVAFKSKRYGNYLRADEKDKVDTYTSFGTNELWNLITEGVHSPSPKPENTYYIKSAHGYYIYMNNKNKVKLMKHNKSYERITIRSLCDYPDPNPDNQKCDIYALKSATHGERYVRDPGKGAGQTVNAQTYVGDGEIFIMNTLSNGKVEFHNRKWHTFLHANEKDKSKLDTINKGATTRDEYTEFTLIPV